MVVFCEIFVDVEEWVDKVEVELKEVNERVVNVSLCFNCRSFCLVWKFFVVVCYYESGILENCCIVRSLVYIVKYIVF